MEMDEAGERANTLVAAWIVRKYRADGSNEHLRGCEATTVAVEGGDGSYGCDTGCDYVRLEAVVTCPHDQRDEFEYGAFAEMSYILEDLERGVDP